MPYLHPAIFTTAVAFVLAMYLVWVLARQQYLGVYQQFNLLCLSLVALSAGVLITQLFYPGYLDIPMSANQAIHALTRPFTITSLLVGYIAAVAVGRWYVATIRYPWWRMADSTVLGLTLIELGWAVGMLLATPTIAIGAATAALSITFLLLLILQQKVAQPGLTVGLHSLAIFAICTGLHLALVSWQSIGTSVEYLAGGIGICLGIAVCIARLRHRVPRVAPITLPTGVSQRFRDTFTRALAPKQPSSKDGSSHGKK